MSEKLWPEPAPLHGYGGNSFCFGEICHPGGIFIVPAGVFAWRPKTFEELTPEDFYPALNCDCDIPFILFGTGEERRAPPFWLMEATVMAGLGLECMKTASAVSTWNICWKDARRPAVFLLPSAR